VTSIFASLRLAATVVPEAFVPLDVEADQNHWARRIEKQDTTPLECRPDAAGLPAPKLCASGHIFFWRISLSMNWWPLHRDMR
jgi:hypothetical protein